jgi:hypothetical protein
MADGVALEREFNGGVLDSPTGRLLAPRSESLYESSLLSTPPSSIAGQSVELSTHASIGALPEDALSVMQSNASANPFVSDFWCTAFERWLIPRHAVPCYVTIRHGGEVSCVLPLLHRRLPLGWSYKLTSLVNFYTGFFDCALTDPAQDEAIHSALARGLGQWVARHGLRSALCEFWPLEEKTDFWNILLSTCASLGCDVRRFESQINWHEAVAGMNYQDYLAGRPGHLRALIPRKQRKLERDLGFQIELISDSTGLSAAMRDFEKVYALSWKSEERSPEFIREICSELANRHQLRLAVLRIGGGIPAAAQIWIKAASRWCLFKLAYDPAFTRYSVGTLLMAHIIEHFLLNDPPETLDFLSGDDAYKQDWVGTRGIRWGVEVIRKRSALGRVAALKRQFRNRDGHA